MSECLPSCRSVQVVRPADPVWRLRAVVRQQELRAHAERTCSAGPVVAPWRTAQRRWWIPDLAY